MAKSTTPTIRFTVPSVPVGQPRPRAVMAGKHARVHELTHVKGSDGQRRPHAITAFKATVRMAAREAYDGPPAEGPLSVTMICVMPRPKGKVWKTKAMPRYPHTSKPDAENVAKAVLDALTNLLWRDDAQVYSLNVQKWVAAGDEQPHVVVELTAATAATEE